MILFLLLPLSNNYDFLFHLAIPANLTLFTYIIKHQTLKVLIRNASIKTLCIPQRHKFGHLIDIAYDNCFFTNI